MKKIKAFFKSLKDFFKGCGLREVLICASTLSIISILFSLFVLVTLAGI